ncbi:hypothetical protein Pcinc_042080 [Petrolisthes cinctipes]|uniref:C-type lectin domain-containing protein n=1 Tax=Petrolisthes cinctipes TaxID=88211 RepID=A0AAE1BLZ5_PETCI|nr:hypothetical protein Pcinc_042080 [Petrolisthes cinctipes]
MRLFQEGELLCRILGGVLKLPLSREENYNLFIQAAPYAGGCGDGIGDTLWLGLRANMKEQFWHGLTTITNSLNFSNFAQNRGLPIEEPEVCVTFKGSRDIMPSSYGTWVPRTCNLERCIACHFHRLPFVRIRGLCAKSEFDREYFLVDVNQTVGFSGVYYSLITKFPPTNNSSGNFGFWRITRMTSPLLQCHDASSTHRPIQPVNVSLHIDIFSIRAFDLTGFNYVCELQVRIGWNDMRVTFHHLNNAEFLNAIHLSDTNKPWMPEVEFFGDAFTASDVQVRRSLLVAQRATGPLPDNDENLVEDEVFAGRDNPFVLIKKLTVTTSCQFDRHHLPLRHPDL